jgi:hypothetical protein
MKYENTRLIKLTATNSTDIAKLSEGEAVKGVDYQFRDSSSYTQTSYLECVEEIIINRPEESELDAQEGNLIVARGTTVYLTQLTFYNLPYGSLHFFHTLKDCDAVTIHFFPYVIDETEEFPLDNESGQEVRVESFSHSLDESGNYFTGVLQLELHRTYRSQCVDNDFSEVFCA